MQDEIVETLQASVPEPDRLPAYLTEAISPLSLFSDEELWQAARSGLPAEDVAAIAVALQAALSPQALGTPRIPAPNGAGGRWKTQARVEGLRGAAGD